MRDPACMDNLEIFLIRVGVSRAVIIGRKEGVLLKVATQKAKDNIFRNNHEFPENYDVEVVVVGTSFFKGWRRCTFWHTTEDEEEYFEVVW